MQHVGAGIRTASRNSLLAAAAHPVASGSRVFQFQGVQQRNASLKLPQVKSPLKWIREALSPGVRIRNTEEEIAAAREKAAESGQLSIFETVPTVPEAEKVVAPAQKKVFTEHEYSTGTFKISHRKLNMLGRQISGKPLDHAIVQMRFSEKRASNRIKSMLAVAKDHAIRYKGMDESKLVVSQAWVNKGPKLKRLDIRGRGRVGIKHHPSARMKVIVKEGPTKEEQRAAERARKLSRIVSAGLVREDVPLRNPRATWAW
ncbi:ribosomal protein L22 [Epithele typhae]|uniref:ribosomal protein L22 n=1 Tax=Epithele typhae TaxID=378194 RepID=UPI00200720CE|nr:ribosomal protein L22 [Epithele typhae]KAH9918213.1 ribosomal protein L22 [Epithele typhae]